jgi:hypothetical protein
MRNRNETFSAFLGWSFLTAISTIFMLEVGADMPTLGYIALVVAILSGGYAMEYGGPGDCVEEDALVMGGVTVFFSLLAVGSGLTGAWFAAAFGAMLCWPFIREGFKS